MSKIYSKTDIEIKAKQLLSPLQMACPDNVWHELSCQLSEEGTRRRALANKFYSPRNLVVALIAVGIVAFGLWELSIRLEGKAVYRQPKINTATTVQETYAQPEKKEVTPVNKPQANLFAVNDSAKPANNTAVAVAPVSTQAAAKPTVQNLKPMPVITQLVKKQASPMLAVRTKINAQAVNSSHPLVVNSGVASDPSSSSPTIADSDKVQSPAPKVVHDSIIDAATPAAGDTTNSN